MDAARRRALRKKKILQNAEDRIKKLIGNVGADVKESNTSGRQKKLGNDSENIDSNIIHETCKTACSTKTEKITELRDKTDGYVSSEKLDKTNEQQSNEGFDRETNETTTFRFNSRILDEGLVKNQDQHTGIKNEMDSSVDKQSHHRAAQEETEENAIDFNAEPVAVDSKISSVRPVIVVIVAMLCFTKSLYLPVISSILGTPWFVEIYSTREFSFIIPFCILEAVLFFTPSIRKRAINDAEYMQLIMVIATLLSTNQTAVTPGKQVNVWLLALKLCGVSPQIVDAAKVVILEILEIITDLAMFIFVLVILQSFKDLYVQTNLTE